MSGKDMDMPHKTTPPGGVSPQGTPPEGPSPERSSRPGTPPEGASSSSSSGLSAGVRAGESASSITRDGGTPQRGLPRRPLATPWLALAFVLLLLAGVWALWWGEKQGGIATDRHSPPRGATSQPVASSDRQAAVRPGERPGAVPSGDRVDADRVDAGAGTRPAVSRPAVPPRGEQPSLLEPGFRPGDAPSRPYQLRPSMDVAARMALQGGMTRGQAPLGKRPSLEQRVWRDGSSIAGRWVQGSDIAGGFAEGRLAAAGLAEGGRAGRGRTEQSAEGIRRVSQGALERPDAPRMAIVIDDWGYPWSAADGFLSLAVPLTVAVIPHLPLSSQHAHQAWEAGYEVILHLPMEPLNPNVKLEPGTIRVDMSPVEIVRSLARGLESVPYVAGVNNHMGSRATADSRVMHTLLAELRRRGLFFLDSRTNPRTAGPAVAQALGVPWAVNQLFLDDVDDEAAILSQLQKAVEMALRDGQVVVIGHVRPATYRALAAFLPKVWEAGIELVYVSELLHHPRGERPASLPVEDWAQSLGVSLRLEPAGAGPGNGTMNVRSAGEGEAAAHEPVS